MGLPRTGRGKQLDVPGGLEGAGRWLCRRRGVTTGVERSQDGMRMLRRCEHRDGPGDGLCAWSADRGGSSGEWLWGMRTWWSGRRPG
eukprot:6208168-Pleurochrysis_carterae.AAC.5